MIWSRTRKTNLPLLLLSGRRPRHDDRHCEVIRRRGRAGMSVGVGVGPVLTWALEQVVGRSD